ncbi:uncharacterized protein [Trachinotus anak]|uniref:uncharacterized protein n=1 Tax=Trachinotus anak TaxID=443729 RepID=UPI0039F250D0
MTEQPTQDRAGQSPASMQTPLHIDLPGVDQEDVLFTISKCLIQISIQHWDLLTAGFVTFDMMSGLAFSCMDIIQTLAEDILDGVMPQVYRHMRANDAFSSTIVRVTEDQIHAYLGDSVGLALTKCMKVNVQNFVYTKLFSELLVRHISKMVNSVLTLSTHAPILESRIPVFFVSGCVSSIEDLEDMAFQMALILGEALNLQEQAEAHLTTLHEPSKEVEPPIICLNSSHDLMKLVRTYIIHRVRVLKSGVQRPHCKIRLSNHRDVCIRVGINTHILTVEDSESDGQESTPGDETKSHPEIHPFHSATVVSTIQSDPINPVMELDTIKKIADELVQALLEDLQGAAQTYGYRKAALGGLEDIDKLKLKEFTDRIFTVIMSGHDYQIPSVPAGTCMCDTVTYRQLTRGDIADPGIVAHTIYMRTEEVVTRCVLQVLLWSALKSQVSQCLSPSLSLEDILDETDLPILGSATGDHVGQPYRIDSQASNTTYDEIPALPDSTQSDMLLRCTVTWLIHCLLAQEGIENIDIVNEAVNKACEHMSSDDVEASLMNKNLEDVSQTLFANLQLEFGSVKELRKAARSGDPSFEEAIVRATRKQLGIPTSGAPYGNEAKKTTCGFFKKFKRICFKKMSKMSCKTTTIIALTTDEDDSELQEHFGKEDDSLREQTQQCWCPCRIPAFIRKKCSSFRKMFSSITTVIGRPFIACTDCPENQ